MSENEGADAPEAPQADADGETESKTEEVVPAYKFEEAKEGRSKERRKRQELEARLAEFEAKERERQEQKLREERRFEELLQEREQQLEAMQKQIAERDLRERRNSLFNAVAEATRANVGEVRRFLMGMIADGELEMPEQLNKQAVDTVARKLKEAAPSLVRPMNSGGTPPQMGPATPNQIDWSDPEAAKKAAFQAGQKLSAKRKKIDNGRT